MREGQIIKGNILYTHYSDFIDFMTQSQIIKQLGFYVNNFRVVITFMQTALYSFKISI